ncbi:MAG TPA: hypothetical protein VF510_22865 [Ktedonobacterales bacterium]
MRDFRRLPLFLRGLAILGLLFPLASLVMFLAMLVLFITGGVVSRQELANDPRALAIALNLGMLGLVCTFVVNRYSKRFLQPNQERFPLDSWQRQARAPALLAALPLCAIALAAVIPLTQDAAFVLVILISLVGAVVLLLTYVRLGVG